MQQTTMAILTLYGALSITLLALRIRHKSVLRQRKRLALKLGSMKGNLAETSERLDLLSRGVDTILSDAPEVHDLLGVHKSLEAAESLLFNQGIPVSNSESCAIVSHAVKALLSHYPEDGPEDERSIVQGLKPLSKRLAAILTEAEMKAEDVELSAAEHRRAGELFHSVERFDWAADCFQRANDLDPEDESALRALSGIQRGNGDLDSLDRTLERLLAIVPDDIEALNEQLVLLDSTDDERLIRNRKRLEALGAASTPSEEEGELSLIAQRARDSAAGRDPQSNAAPGLIEKAAKQSEAHGNKPANVSAEEWAMLIAHRTRKGSTAKKVAPKKTAKKVATKKSAAQKPAAKKAVAKKAVAKKAVTKKVVAKKAAPTTTAKPRKASRAKKAPAAKLA